MTDTTEQAKEALLNYQQADEEGVMALASRQAIHEVVDALTALQAELARVKAQPERVAVVKPLEWEDYPINEPVISMAETPLGTYFICDDTDDFTGLYLEFVSHKDATWYGTVTADCVELSAHNHIDDHSPLQATAQADYERRITSALNIQTKSERMNVSGARGSFRSMGRGRLANPC